MNVARNSPPEVMMFTDGACLGNPGPGGYAAILTYKDHRKELVGGFRRTTNNRMELTAVIKGLEALKRPSRVQLFCDSEYVLNSLSKGWARGWRAARWRRKGNVVVPNWELWDILLALYERHDVSTSWIQGHSGHVENEWCDAAAKRAAAAAPTEPDEGFERPSLPP